MRRIVTIVVLTVLLASCSSADNTATQGPATTQPAATGNIDSSFDVGGHKLHLRCEGKSAPGSPTVIYLHGLGGDGSDVTSISPRLTSQVRVCTYDRLNVGRSDSDPGRHTGADSVRDLHALLDAADVAGPYLLVGFSFGGLLAIMYAATYPDQVMGLVSLDGSLPTDDQVDQLIPKDERARVMAEQDANQERVEFYPHHRPGQAAGRQAAGRAGHLPGRPTGRAPPELAGEAHAGVHRRQAGPVHQGRPQGRLVEVQSSHDIDQEQPELVIKEINRILKMA